ncbi:syntaxin-binding protein 3-like [Scleropages formosus]|uniref:syntaxin-binding protein 3-like n=1 Tax=Scleropages formosus TaxID=113540 RepID=UPI0010FA87EE|nr:syntaxin-binding protein 3-like [Scleropages formosus]
MGIKETIEADCRKSEVWKMMILDNFTMKLLSLCCRMSDLISGGITIVKDLFKIRKPVPDLKAIYFMIPTAKCVDVLIVDFKIKPKYKAAYVYFAEACPDSVFNKMKLSCAKPIRVCKEIGVSVLSQESHVKFRLKDGRGKEAQLDENDELWVNLRHLRIAGVSK